jgi:ADP-dependent NAD(P)H-hydrate dehydratase / NAD(P)H-hydrate epimerase
MKLMKRPGKDCIGADDILKLARKRDSHKGDNGTALVIGGSAEYVGAAYLASMAALRAGCDKVIVAAPEKVAWTLNSMSPDLITVKLPGRAFGDSHFPLISRLIGKCDAFLIGNGMGQSPHALGLCRKIVRKHPESLKIIDADAISAIRFQDAKNAIMTPHEKELQGIVKRSTKGLGDTILVQKGHIDVIRSQTRMKKICCGNAMMTVGGTGDVLAGLALGFLAESRDRWRSACTAAFINGQIGDALWKEQGTMLASDFLPRIPSILKDRLSIRFL